MPLRAEDEERMHEDPSHLPIHRVRKAVPLEKKGYRCCCSLIPVKVILVILAAIEILTAALQIFDSSKQFASNSNVTSGSNAVKDESGSSDIRSFRMKLFILIESVLLFLVAFFLLLGLFRANKWLLIPHMTLTGGLSVLFLVLNTLLLIGVLQGDTFISPDVDSVVKNLRSSFLLKGTTLEENQVGIVSAIAVGSITALLCNIWVLFCLVAGYRYASDMGAYRTQFVLESVPLAEFHEH